jgi:O-antigen ligase
MGTSPFTILGMLALAVWIFSGRWFKDRAPLFQDTWILPVAAVFALSWVGLLWSHDPSGLGIDYAKKSYYWLYALVVAGVSVSGKPAEWFVRAFLWGLSLNAGVGLLQLFKIVPRFSQWGKTGYTGLSGGYNTLAILLVLGMMVASFYYRKAVGKRKKAVYGAMAGLFLIHLLIMEGRGGYVTFVLMLPVIIYNFTKGRRVTVIILACLVAIGVMFTSHIVRTRVDQTIRDLKQHLAEGEEISSGKKYSTHLDRIYMWRWAGSLFLKYPLLGVGTGGYGKAVLQEGGDKAIAHPHNNILYVASSFGILGLGIFFWLFWSLFKTAWHHRQEAVGFFILSSTMVILGGGFTDTHILDAGGGFLLAVTVGLQPFLKLKEAELYGTK